MSDVTPDPFEEVIVKDPRRSEVAVAGVNERPLQALLKSFERLDQRDPPRPVHSAAPALLVTSAQPGYGKSHLIGRLFRELHGRATLVYVQPFQGAATAFQSLMLAVVREMHFPERATAGAWDGEAPTQLDSLAHAVLAHLLADLIEGRVKGLQVEASAETARQIRRSPSEAFARGADPWAHWLYENWEQISPHFEEALALRGIALTAPGSWLRLLLAYAFSPFNPAVRRVCLDWLSGLPVDREDALALGLRAADANPEELSLDHANALARTRLTELCQLAAFCRPFVFCFDQTEVYGHRAELARAFGMMVATLVHEAPNQLTVITANQDPWTARVLPHIEMADRDRLAPPLPMEGLNRAQAAELARLRLGAAEVEGARIGAFLEAKWLNTLFPTPANQMGARQFLQKCRERWNRAPVAATPLAQLFQRHREKILASPRRQLFEADTLHWLVEDAARGVPGVTVEALPEKYVQVRWVTPERVVLFGFAAGANWRQWRNIARLSVERNRAGNGVPTKCVFFRTPEQAAIPGEKWAVRAEIEEARRETLDLVRLSPEELAELYAARDLFAEAAQGDIDYTTEQVLGFLREELGGWWGRLRGAVGGGS